MKATWLALCLLAPGCVGTADAPSDAPPGPDAERHVGCDPVNQTGCESSEKCTFLVSDGEPLTGFTGCAPTGLVEIGQPCSFQDDADDCIPAAWCDLVARTCQELCPFDDPTSCAAGTCQAFEAGEFADVEESLGACRP